MNRERAAGLDARYSGEDATPRAWSEGRRRPETAEVYWIPTVRPGGNAHVTPLMAVWLGGAPYFCTGRTQGEKP